MKPDNIYALPVISDPRLSPDGRMVAFTVTRADRESNSYRSAIWLVPADGSRPPRRLTAGDVRDMAPRWSPDSQQLAFISDRAGAEPQLYVLPLEGGEPQRLSAGGPVTAPAWSPDGNRIAYVSALTGPDAADSRQARQAPWRITRVGYKADGTGWKLGKSEHIFVVPADGSGPPRQVTDGDLDHSQPAWSPDGRQIAFTANRDDDSDLSLARDIYLADAEGGHIRRLTKGDAMYSRLAWSPDGRSIAAHCYPDIDSAPRNQQVVVADPETGEVRSLTADLDMQCGPAFEPTEPRWTRAGILFSCETAGRCHIWLAKPDGGREPVVTGDIAVSGFDADATGGTVVHVASTATRPHELFCGERQLTGLTRHFTASVALAGVEEFTATAADGTCVQAWAMPPVDAASGNAYPTLLFIHGGPFTQYGVAFFDEFQVASGAGLAVVYCNPRGSSGYGEDWGRAIRGPISGGPGWGTLDADDVLAVADEAVRRFSFCDGGRLGVLGGSYGGFLTAWLIGHTSRFKAACAERGVYNVLSAIGTSDELWSAGTVLGGDPYQHIAEMMRISPISYVDQITTPLLLVAL